MAAAVYAADYVVLVIVPAELVRDLVCIFIGLIYGFIARCTFGDQCAQLCVVGFCVTLLLT